MISKNLFKFFRFILPWIVTFVIFVFLLKEIKIEGVLISLSQMNLALILLASVISAFACIYIGVEKNKYILNMLGCRLSSEKVRALRLGSLPIKAILPLKSGELTRTVYLNKEYQLPYEKGLSSIVLGYISRLLVLISVLLIGLAVYLSCWWPFIILASIVFGVILFIRTKTNELRNISLTIFYSVLLELCLIGNFYVVFRAVGIDISFAVCILFVPLTMLISSIPISIAGFGVREGTILLLFSGLAPQESLFAAGLMSSLINDFLPAFIGLYFLQPFIIKLISTNAKESDPSSYLNRRKRNPLTRYRLYKRSEKILKIIKQYKNNEKLRLLDIGAADGAMLGILNSELNLEKAVGIEPSDTLRLAGKNPGIEILAGNGEDIPFSENEFDVVVIASVIEHVKDAEKVFYESYRVLKKEGLLVMTAVDPFFDKAASFLGIKPDDHFRTYNLKELQKLFIENKFNVKLVERFGPIFYELVVGEKE